MCLLPIQSACTAVIFTFQRNQSTLANVVSRRFSKANLLVLQLDAEFRASAGWNKLDFSISLPLFPSVCVRLGFAVILCLSLYLFACLQAGGAIHQELQIGRGDG